jgi:hypothetical protein
VGSAVRSVDNERADGAGLRAALAEPPAGRPDTATWQQPVLGGPPRQLGGLEGLLDDVAAVRDPVPAVVLDAGQREPESRFGCLGLLGPVHEWLVQPDLLDGVLFTLPGV